MQMAGLEERIASFRIVSVVAFTVMRNLRLGVGRRAFWSSAAGSAKSCIALAEGGNKSAT